MGCLCDWGGVLWRCGSWGYAGKVIGGRCVMGEMREVVQVRFYGKDCLRRWGRKCLEIVSGQWLKDKDKGALKRVY